MCEGHACAAGSTVTYLGRREEKAPLVACAGCPPAPSGSGGLGKGTARRLAFQPRPGSCGVSCLQAGRPSSEHHASSVGPPGDGVSPRPGEASISQYEYS